MDSKVIHSQLFELAPNKSQKTRVSIAEAAIKTIVKIGIENANYGEISKTAGLSRTIVQRYFPHQDDLLDFMFKYIRVNYQQYVIERFTKVTGPLEQLKTYLSAAMNWPSDYPDHANAWLLFFYYCGIRKGFRALNTHLVEMGYNRLRELILVGIGERQFKVHDVETTARQIHLLLSGTIMAIMTEEEDFNKRIKSQTLAQCLNLLRASARR